MGYEVDYGKSRVAGLNPKLLSQPSTQAQRLYHSLELLADHRVRPIVVPKPNQALREAVSNSTLATSLHQRSGSPSSELLSYGIH